MTWHEAVVIGVTTVVVIGAFCVAIVVLGCTC
jgi:hypothetical protein